MGDPPRFRYRLVSTELTEHLGYEMTGRHADEIAEPDVRRYTEQFYEQALLPSAQQVVEGKITGQQAGELAYKVAKEWREFNPDIVENYKKWSADLGG